jgi:hypothetical protein
MHEFFQASSPRMVANNSANHSKEQFAETILVGQDIPCWVALQQSPTPLFLSAQKYQNFGKPTRKSNVNKLSLLVINLSVSCH